MRPFLIDPSILPVPTYLLIISLTYCIGLFWIYKRTSHNEQIRNTALNLSLLIMIFGFLGARIFHILLEHPRFYLENPLKIFEVYSGGFVFYGGMLFSALSCLIYLKAKKERLSPWMDLFAPPLALGYALGRIGCFMAGCCFGKECHLPWAVTFPKGVEAPYGIPLHPTQLYSTLLGLLVVCFLAFSEKKKLFKIEGMLFYMWLVLHSIQRLFIEQFRADWRGENLFGFSPSTWLSLLLLSLATALIVITLKKETK